MKKFLSLFLALCLLFSALGLASCGDKKGDDTTGDTTVNESGEVTTDEGNTVTPPEALKGKEAFFTTNSTLSALAAQGQLVKDKNVKYNMSFILDDEKLLGQKASFDIAWATDKNNTAATAGVKFGAEEGKLDIIANGTNMYIGGGTLLSKYVKLNDVSEDIPSIDTKAIATSVEALSQKLLSYVKTSLADDKFVDSTEEVELDGAKITLNVVTLELGNEELVGIGTEMIKAIAQDNALLSAIAQLTGSDVDSVKGEINNMLTGKDDEADTSKLATKISVKLYNNIVVGTDVTFTQTEDGEAEVIKFAYTYLVGTASDIGTLTFEAPDTKVNATYTCTDKSGKAKYAVNIIANSTEEQEDYENPDENGDYPVITVDVKTEIAFSADTVSSEGGKSVYNYTLSLKNNDIEAAKVSGQLTETKASLLKSEYEITLKIESGALPQALEFTLKYGYEYTDDAVETKNITDDMLYTIDLEEETPAFATELFVNMQAKMPSFYALISTIMDSADGGDIEEIPDYDIVAEL